VGISQPAAAPPYQNRVGRWNGATWTDLGDSVSIYPYALASYRGEWYVGGLRFGLPGAALQRWDGAAWRPAGERDAIRKTKAECSP
jgi:hypothetical protein